jgi:cysteine desulfurase
MKHSVYLDYNASSPLRPEAAISIANLQNMPLNASAVHAYGREGRKHIENARKEIAALVNCEPNAVIFNSGATEGNNTVLQYFKGRPILVSCIEHPSVLDVVPHSIKIPVTKDGIVDLGALEDLLQKEKPALVSVMMVNNETGIIQPIAAISSLAKQYGAYLHCDAVQAAGRIPISLFDCGIDFLTLSAHKIGGPQGVGALILGLCGETPVLLHGGGQEKKARAGTENVSGIAGFGAAARAAQDSMSDVNARLSSLRDTLEQELTLITPQIQIIGGDQTRVANTSFFTLPGVSSETMMMALDLEGFAISNGSACSSGTVKTSAVLKSMGRSDSEASGAIRLSMGWNTKSEDIENFLIAWRKLSGRWLA